MARFDFEIPQDFINSLKKSSNLDEIIPKMIDESMPIIEQSLSKNLSKH